MENIQEVWAPATLDGGEGLLAVIIRSGRFNLGTHFYTAPTEPLQTAGIFQRAGHEIPPHVHKPRHRVIERTQEVLILQFGTVLLTIFTSDGEEVRQVRLTDGDVVVLVAGGHGLKWEEDSHIIEVKQGPYHGREYDKTALPPH